MSGQHSFSSSIRNFFASAGLCESADDLERRPAVINKLIERAVLNADTQGNLRNDVPYEIRLRCALDQAMTRSLDYLLENDITVCLDQRLSTLKQTSTCEQIFCMFYNTPGNRVLSLFDNGNDPESAGMLTLSARDHAANAINEIVAVIQEEGQDMPALKLGSYVCTHRLAHFYWKDEFGFTSELEKNPDIKTPPLKTGAPLLKSSPTVKRV